MHTKNTVSSRDKTTVRISTSTRNKLKEIADQENTTLLSVLERAVELYRRQQFLQDVNEAYQTLQQNEKELAELESVYQEFDTTLSDGLSMDENWIKEGEVDDESQKGK